MDAKVADLLSGAGLHNIIIPKKSFIKEHRHLINLLNRYDIPALNKEADSQAKELKEMTGGRMGQATGFVRRMMAENALKHKGQYGNPTSPLHPGTTMNKAIPFDYSKLPNKSPFIVKHFGQVGMTPFVRKRGTPRPEEPFPNRKRTNLIRDTAVAQPEAPQLVVQEIERPAPAPAQPQPRYEVVNEPEPKIDSLSDLYTDFVFKENEPNEGEWRVRQKAEMANSAYNTFIRWIPVIRKAIDEGKLIRFELTFDAKKKGQKTIRWKSKETRDEQMYYIYEWEYADYKRELETLRNKAQEVMDKINLSDLTYDKQTLYAEDNWTPGRFGYDRGTTKFETEVRAINSKAYELGLSADFSPSQPGSVGKKLGDFLYWRDNKAQEFRKFVKPKMTEFIKYMNEMIEWATPENLKKNNEDMIARIEFYLPDWKEMAEKEEVFEPFGAEKEKKKIEEPVVDKEDIEKWLGHLWSGEEKYGLENVVKKLADKYGVWKQLDHIGNTRNFRVYDSSIDPIKETFDWLRDEADYDDVKQMFLKVLYENKRMGRSLPPPLWAGITDFYIEHKYTMEEMDMVYPEDGKVKSVKKGMRPSLDYKDINFMVDALFENYGTADEWADRQADQADDDVVAWRASSKIFDAYIKRGDEISKQAEAWGSKNFFNDETKAQAVAEVNKIIGKKEEEAPPPRNEIITPPSPPRNEIITPPPAQPQAPPTNTRPKTPEEAIAKWKQIKKKDATELEKNIIKEKFKNKSIRKIAEALDTDFSRVQRTLKALDLT